MVVSSAICRMPVCMLLSPAIAEKQSHLRHNAGAGVENYIAHGSGSRRQKALMPFIETGNEARPQYRNVGPPEGPFRSRRSGQSLSPGPEQKNTQQSVPDHVSRFPDEKVIRLKAGLVDPKQEMQNWIENAAGVLRREIRRRFDRNNDEPEDQGDPGFQDLVAIVGQAGQEWVFPPSAQNMNSLPRGERTGRASGPLFDRIVGGFTRDHDVVHMALAKAGAADAHEARLLQQFSNRGASAISHARLQPSNHLVDDHRD